MRKVTIQEFYDVVGQIIYDREELTKLKRQEFIGVTQDEVFLGIKKWLGESNWMLVKASPSFSKEDIDAVANNRFFRQTGAKLLMAWAIIILAFAIFTLTFRLIPLQVYYGLSIVVTIVFLYSYSKKQNKMRSELQKAVYGSKKVEAGREK